MDRRSFIKSAAAGAGLLAAGKPAAHAGPVNLALPSLGLHHVSPTTPIDHVVVVMMENRSVDHYLGWYGSDDFAGDKFDATQTGSYHSDATGGSVPTEHWGTGSARSDFSGCGFEDPGHGHSAGVAQIGNGKAETSYMVGGTAPDGFLNTNSGNDEFAVSYYQPDDIPVTAALTEQFTTFDRYFCSWLGSTYPNREYMHSAQTGGITNNDFPPQRATENPEWAAGFDWPTIWTALDARGVTWKYYYSNLPVIALWGARHAKGARHISEYYADCAAGTLPQVAFIDPFFVAPDGLANDDHPWADIRLGQMLLSDVTRSFMESKHWHDGALFVTYDEWGGFWDHVTPPEVADPRSADPAGEFGKLGFRVPTQLISPFASGGRVDHRVYDHTSILKFIQTNWRLKKMSQWDPGTRDPEGRNIGNAFGRFRYNGASRDRFLNTPHYEAPGTANVPCAGHDTPVSDLFQLLDNGWMETYGFRTDFPFADAFRSTLPILR
ncbi:MAG: alkaline phosphatase family protein [Acidimicrobiales bacterium]